MPNPKDTLSLVERLRSKARHKREVAATRDGQRRDYLRSEAVMFDAAADEIERLNTECETSMVEIDNLRKDLDRSQGGAPDGPSHWSARWSLLSIAVSGWMSQASGLPVDFQFQRMSVANAKFDGERQALGMYVSHGDARPQSKRYRYFHGEPPMSDTQKLKPCPFCGGEAAPDPTYAFGIGCTKCSVLGPMGLSSDEAADRWNRRATPHQRDPAPPVI